MELFEVLRREYAAGETILGLAKKHGMHRRMVRQAISSAIPPERKKSDRAEPKLGPVKEHIDRMLDSDREAPRKQRHTAHRIWMRLRAEHPERTISESQVRRYVRQRKHELGLAGSEVFVPQSYHWGQEAQVDWYEATVREGHYILDFLVENTSDIQPDTIHADTQGQSAAIFGLAHLLGIQLQPRIRNWKNLHFFRPEPDIRYKHIDLLFTQQVEWNLIETMLPEMLRVALSIGAGRIRPSAILRRLATYSRKNKLYFAFRELGRVVRTVFLLDYISNIDLRRTIQAATNKSEAFNLFVQWVAFGGGRLLAENTRDEQRKMIKYHHLVANLLIFHNVVSMTKALQLLMADGNRIDEEALACFSPCQTDHINRFGRYALNRDRVLEPLDRIRALRMPPRSEGPTEETINKSVTI